MNIEINNTSKEYANEFVKQYHFYMDYAQPNGSVEHKVLLNTDVVGIFQYGFLPCSSPIGGYPPDKCIGLSRMAFSIHKPNLPTASLSKSIGKFKQEYGRQRDIKLLIAYSRIDFEGTVYQAYGFDFDGISEGREIEYRGDIPTVGNRPARKIYAEDKKRWIKEL